MTEIRKFGLLFAALCAAAAGYSIYGEGTAWPYFLVGAAFFLVTGLLFEFVLKPVYTAWMKFAQVLGWVNTRLVLGLFFYAVITPVGLIRRILGKDSLKRKFDRAAESYWVKREPVPFDRQRYERQF